MTLITPVMLRLPSVLKANQEQFTHTGGVHAAGLFDQQGNLVAIREDIGRHNALDKLAGCNLNTDVSDKVIVVSGRSSYELVQKTAMLGVPILLSIGPASSMAAMIADQEGITLVGFLSEHSFNIYTHPERIRIK